MFSAWICEHQVFSSIVLAIATLALAAFLFYLISEAISDYQIKRKEAKEKTEGKTPESQPYVPSYLRPLGVIDWIGSALFLGLALIEFLTGNYRGALVDLGLALFYGAHIIYVLIRRKSEKWGNRFSFAFFGFMIIGGLVALEFAVKLLYSWWVLHVCTLF